MVRLGKKNYEDYKLNHIYFSDHYPQENSSGCLFRDLFSKFTHLSEYKKSPHPPPPLPNPRPNLTKTPKRHRPKPITDGCLTFIQSFLTVTLAGISLVYICVQRTSTIYTEHVNLKNQSSKPYLCQLIGSNNSNQNIVMLPFSLILTLVLIIIHQLNNPERKKSFSFQLLLIHFKNLIVFIQLSFLQ